jgi:hypothetical protein
MQQVQVVEVEPQLLVVMVILQQLVDLEVQGHQIQF